MKCLCAHPRHPCSRCPVTACGCGTYRPATAPLTAPTLVFDPAAEEGGGEIAAREKAG